MRRVLLLLPWLLAACAPPWELAPQLRQSIIGGVPAPDDHAVFFIDNDAGVCSATLIASRTLVTAAHCVEAVPMFAMNHARIDAPGDGGMYTVVKRLTWAQATDGGSADLALLLLDRPPPATPKAWTWWGPPPAVMSGVRHVGYGRSEGGPAGERRSVTTTVSGAVVNRTQGMVLVSGDFGKGLCFGDSGGGAFMPTASGERLGAVHSFITAECGAGVSSSVLLYPYRRFLEAWLAANEGPDCAREGRCVPGCVPEDPDCRCGADGVCQPFCAENDDPDCPNECRVDGVCQPRSMCPAGDGDCIPDGEACLSAGQCGGGSCITDPQNPTRYCSQACSPAVPCPDFMTCDGARALCILKQLPIVGEGADCGPLVKCAQGTACTVLGAARRCLRTCTSQANCLAGTRCQFGATSVCVPLSPIALDAGATWEGPLAPVGCSHGGGLAFTLAVVLWPRRKRRA
ncbi:MAG: trypsin-like serine protease [Myxococcaceae bacterium]|nr:trypsin-like serine protease [Myxococcaceae bacterium]